MLINPQERSTSRITPLSDFVECFAARADPLAKSVKHESSEFEPSMAHENLDIDSSGTGLDGITNAEIIQEKAKSIVSVTKQLPQLSDDGVLYTWIPSRFRNEASQIPKANEISEGEALDEVSTEADLLAAQHRSGQNKGCNFKMVLSIFGLGERPLAQGKTRVRWRCGCGRNMYDDFTELRSGAAAELEKWLNDSIRKHAGSHSSEPRQTSQLTSAALSNMGSSRDQQTAGSDISLQSLASQTNTLLVSNGNAASALDVHLVKCWLLVCGNSKRGPDSLLKQLDISHTPSDKDLFVEMNNLYSNLRSAWGLRPFLRGVKTIRFVQVTSSIRNHLLGVDLIATSSSSIRWLALIFVKLLTCHRTP